MDKKQVQIQPDDGIPAGDSPAKPKWPLYLSAAAWGTWLAFMVVMMVLRIYEAPRLK